MSFHQIFFKIQAKVLNLFVKKGQLLHESCSKFDWWIIILISKATILINIVLKILNITHFRHVSYHMISFVSIYSVFSSCFFVFFYLVINFPFVPFKVQKQKSFILLVTYSFYFLGRWFPRSYKRSRRSKIFLLS